MPTDTTNDNTPDNVIPIRSRITPSHPDLLPDVPQLPPQLAAAIEAYVDVCIEARLLDLRRTYLADSEAISAQVSQIMTLLASDPSQPL